MSLYRRTVSILACAIAGLGFVALAGCGGAYGGSTATATKTIPAITWATPVAVTVGTALSSTQLDATTTVPGSFVYSPAAGTVESTAGTVMLSVTFTPTDSTQYDNATSSVSLTVNPAAKTTPTITWATPTPIAAGTALSSTQLDATANVPGTFVYSPAAGTVEPSNGNYPLSVTFTPTDTVDYTTATAAVDIIVTIPTVLAWPAPAPIFVGTALSSIQLDAFADLPGTAVYNPPAGTVESTVGTVTLNVTFTPIPNPSGFTTNTGSITLTVNPLPPPKTNPTISWTAPAAVTAGTALSSTQLNATADVPGTLVYSPPAGAIESTTGAVTLSATFIPTDTTTYNNATASVPLKVTAPAAQPGPALSGSVHHGQAAIAGARVYLFAANTTGYGQPSVSLLHGGTTDSVGAYVTTAADGSFTMNGNYNCVPYTQLYLYALGGSAGTNNQNVSSGLLAALGNCPVSGSSAPPAIWINEVSTVAAAYAMAGFATDATHVSSSGTPLAQTGIANAFANAANLANLSTGAALSTTPSGNGAVPQSQIDTLANILAACVGANASSAGSTPPLCSTLFANATADGTATGAPPADTATAAINLAHHPGSNLAPLYTLATSSGTYTPAASTQPNDFTIALNFTDTGFNEPVCVTIDGSGNAWINNFTGTGSSYFSELSSSGVLLSPPTGFPAAGQGYSGCIALDSSGNAWFAQNSENFTTFSAIGEMSSAGVTLSPPAGFSSGGVGNITSNGYAFDGSGNLWLGTVSVNGENSLAELSSAGTVLSPFAAFTAPDFTAPANLLAVDAAGHIVAQLKSPNNYIEFSTAGQEIPPTVGAFSCGVPYTIQGTFSLAIDHTGDIWISNENGVQKFSNSTQSCSGTGAGAGPLVLDGAGNVWVGNGKEFIGELSNSGATIASGYTGGVLIPPGDNVEVGPIANIAVDGSGNVWSPYNYGNPPYGIVEFIGVATPVVTPLATAVKTNTLGARP
jgi:hypothetical protein